MRKMSKDIRNKVNTYIRNGLDISELIQDCSIKGENLSRAIITKFNRLKDDMTGCNLSGAIIGTEGETSNLSGSIVKNCCFKGAKFKGKLVIRKSNVRGSNFTDCFMPYTQHQFSDFRGCKFCRAIIQIGSYESIGSKFDEDFFKDLGKSMGVDITINSLGNN